MKTAVIPTISPEDAANALVSYYLKVSEDKGTYEPFGIWVDVAQVTEDIIHQVYHLVRGQLNAIGVSVTVFDMRTKEPIEMRKLN